MIVNNGDLLPLNPIEPAAAKPAPPAAAPSDELDFLAQIQESTNSIDFLLAARAEAEEAEKRAKQAGETPLLYLKDVKKNAPAPVTPSTGFTAGGSADDADSPAGMGFLGSDLRRLSDATSIQSNSIDDYAPKPPAAPAPRTVGDELDDLLAPAARPIADQSGGAADHGAPVEAVTSLAETHISELLQRTVEYGASDLHLTTGLPPMVRKDGRVTPLPYDRGAPREIQRIVYDILSTEQIAVYERTHELDFSYGVPNVGRFRFNVYRQRGSVACAMRVIPNKIPSMEQLKLPPVIRELTRKHSGLVLVTGPTGSGKSTTIASIIDIINTERDSHILTIEDPIEYLHLHKKSMVNQRELGGDTISFNNALRAALREDPDVILVGEMRDLETISAAITLAETGHLVFATLHTRSAPATIDRIVDVFPAHQQDQIRIQLSTSIEAVVAQQLLPKIGGGRVAAIEIMIATSALRNLIREGKTYQINSVIETGQQYGMQSMDRMLAELHRSGTVTYEEAATRAIDRENFQRLVKGY
ncbi:MAG: Twitching mobility protein [Capsulimonas sp.]|nr:Twitching mobility protein [Capsulimonas sp.]